MAGIVGSKAARASGGTVTTAGPYTLHAFTTTGANTFTPTSTGFVDILLVGGGGPGSSGATGGGGAGATLFKKMIPVTASTPYPFSVGAGGPTGVSGTPTTFIYSGITTTASGGGFGGPDGASGAGGNVPTASGGGCGGRSPSGSTSTHPGGTGAGVLGIGYPGGSNGGPFPSPIVGGGGGGAGGAGQAGFPAPGGRGGVGVPITYFTGISTDMASVGGPAGTGSDLTGITSTSYGSGGHGGTLGYPSPSGAPGVAYIRYI